MVKVWDIIFIYKIPKKLEFQTFQRKNPFTSKNVVAAKTLWFWLFFAATSRYHHCVKHEWCCYIVPSGTIKNFVTPFLDLQCANLNFSEDHAIRYVFFNISGQIVTFELQVVRDKFVIQLIKSRILFQTFRKATIYRCTACFLHAIFQTIAMHKSLSILTFRLRKINIITFLFGSDHKNICTLM